MHIPQLTMPFIALSEPECWAIIVAATLMALDVLWGVVAALIRHDFQSAKMREGLGHKATLVVVVVLAVIVQGASGHIAELGFTVPLIVPACAYIIVMEVASVLETACDTYPSLADTPLMSIFDTDRSTTGEGK